MDPRTQQFLQLVLPELGWKVLAIPAPNKKGFRHSILKSAAGLADTASEYSHTTDVYYALAGYRERVVEVTLNTGEVKRKVRLASNAGWARALWLDVDCNKPDAKGYPTKQEGAAAITAAVREIGLPAPLIIDSGGGFHCYWPMSRDVEAADWLAMATRFKALTKAVGLRADPTRTADIASVLRVPGTLNHKRGEAVPVRFVRGPERAAVLSPEEIDRILTLAAERVGVDTAPLAPRPAHVANDLNGDLAAGLYDSEPADPKRVIAGCPQMRRIATVQEQIEEPLWYAALQVVRLCSGASSVAHAISRRHPGYSAENTERKLVQLEEKGIGPTTCARFADLYGEGCRGCAHQGKVTTPLQLGRRPPAPAPTPVAQVNGVEFQLPDPPEPYVRTKRGQIAIVLNDEDGTPQAPEIIYQYDLYPVRRIFDEFTGKTRTAFRTVLPIRGEFEFEIDNQDLYDSRVLPKVLANADLLPSPAKVKILGDYMVSYTQKLQERAEAVRLYMQMGWREGGKFIVGNRMISPKETPRVIGVSSATALASEKLTQAGDLEAWKRVVAAYAQPGMEPYLFGFATAFGAPLFGFTNYSGAIINMMSKPGTGKSTVLKAMNSVYGHPESLMFSKEDTTKSVYRRIGVYNSLPIAFDEITNIDPTELSDLAYNFSQGRERMRLNSNATERRDAYKWQTIMAATSNSSLHDKLGALKADASAETVRIFEYRMPDDPPIDAVTAKQLFDQLYDNYGLAGDAYLQFLVDNLPWVRQQLDKMIALVFQKSGATSTERFWVAIVAANLTGLLVAKKVGLISFDAQALLNWAIAQQHAMRGSVAESSANPIDAIALFLNSHVRDTLVVDSSSNNLGTSAMLRKPTGELICRLELDTGVMFVDRAVIKRWCAKSNVGYSWLRRELASRFVLLDTNRRKCLGAGTDFATAQAACWVLDMTTSHMGELKATISRGDVVDINSRKEKQA